MPFQDEITKMLIEVVAAIYKFALGICKDMTTITGDLLARGWDNLLPGSQTANIASTMTNVSHSVIMPIGLSLLTLALLIQLVKISGRIDGTQAMPAIKEIFVFFAIATIFTYLIRNSMEICRGLYSLFNGVASGSAFKELTGDQVANSIKTICDNLGTSNDMGTVILVLLVGLVFILISCLSLTVGIASVLGRGLQLYVMAFFAPVPLSMLAIDETRQIGVGFLKNFAGLCLAGAIMALTMWIYPRLLLAALADASTKEVVTSFAASGSVVTGIKWLFEAIAINIVYMMAMKNSGAWAKDILGS